MARYRSRTGRWCPRVPVDPTKDNVSEYLKGRVAASHPVVEVCMIGKTAGVTVRENEHVLVITPGVCVVQVVIDLAGHISGMQSISDGNSPRRR